MAALAAAQAETRFLGRAEIFKWTLNPKLTISRIIFKILNVQQKDFGGEKSQPPSTSLTLSLKMRKCMYMY